MILKLERHPSRQQRIAGIVDPTGPVGGSSIPVAIDRASPDAYGIGNVAQLDGVDLSARRGGNRPLQGESLGSSRGYKRSCHMLADATTDVCRVKIQINGISARGGDEVITIERTRKSTAAFITPHLHGVHPIGGQSVQGQRHQPSAVYVDASFEQILIRRGQTINGARLVVAAEIRRTCPRYSQASSPGGTICVREGDSIDRGSRHEVIGVHESPKSQDIGVASNGDGRFKRDRSGRK